MTDMLYCCCGCRAGFLANVFDVFRSNKVSVDVVATSEVSITLSLDPKKSWSDGEVCYNVVMLELTCYILRHFGCDAYLMFPDVCLQCYFMVTGIYTTNQKPAPL